MINPKDLDVRVRPQDDFFRFSVGGWIKRNPIPADKSRWGTFDLLREESVKQLKEVIDSLPKKPKQGSFEQLVADFWRSAMDEREREKRGLKPLEPILKKIQAVNTKQDLLDYISYAHRTGMGLLWHIYVSRDDKHSERNTLFLSQGGLSLPDRDFYLNDDADSKRVRGEFMRYIPRLLRLAQYEGNKEKVAELVMKIETALARASMTRVERRDPHKQYNVRTLGSLKKESPNINWVRYFAQVHAKPPKQFIVGQPKFFKEVSRIIDSITLEEWKTYLIWSAIDDMSPLLTKKLIQEHFRFYSTVLSGTKKMQPLWKRSVGVIDGMVGDALGKLYVEKFFDARAKHRINELVNNLFAAYRERLEELPWMGTATKKKAFIKLRGMKRKLGYPNKWHAYKGLKIVASDYVGNIIRTHEHEFARMLGKLKKKPDPDEWYMTPPTVNAYFDPNANEIAFPAGIMQPPFFDLRADDAINYGAIGSVIGHEITHGFDDEGSKFDHKGNLKNWWTAQDRKRFEKRAVVLQKQFDSFVAIDGMHVNGKLTLGENIADLGGLIIAFKAFQKSQKSKKPEKIGGFSPEQRFFLGYAITEAGNIRPELLKQRLVTDPHSPSNFRVNGPLSNMEEFYEAFGVKKGHKLFRSPASRAKIW